MCLNNTHTEFWHANHDVKEQLGFYYVLDKLVIASSSEKDVKAQFICANITLTKSNKALTEQLLTQATTIARLI